MSLAAWLGFLLAAILIAVTPGPGAVLSMSTGIRHGYRAAFSAILGLQLALLIHLALVAALMIVFPISKLLHAPGLFFSPTRNQADTSREARHVAAWAAALDEK